MVPDGERIFLDKGDVGYIRAGRVHDAKYIEACRLVYVHNGAFAFHLARPRSAEQAASLDKLLAHVTCPYAERQPQGSWGPDVRSTGVVHERNVFR